jgi:hypothetical protein
MNSGGLQPVTTAPPVAAFQTPAIVAVYGEKGAMRSLEFFAPNIRNPDFPLTILRNISCHAFIKTHNPPMRARAI